MSAPEFDRLLARLVDADVRFVVVGGLALGSWGVVRGTKDVDVVIDLGPGNVRALAELVVEIGGRVETGESLLGSADSIAGLLAAGERAFVETDLGPLDVVQGFAGMPSYDELRERATRTEILGVEVAVCSVDDLRSMKRAAGRTRDLADLEDLNALYGGGEDP